MHFAARVLDKREIRLAKVFLSRDFVSFPVCVFEKSSQTIGTLPKVRYMYYITHRLAKVFATLAERGIFYECFTGRWTKHFSILYRLK